MLWDAEAINHLQDAIYVVTRFWHQVQQFSKPFHKTGVERRLAKGFRSKDCYFLIRTFERLAKDLHLSGGKIFEGQVVYSWYLGPIHQLQDLRRFRFRKMLTRDSQDVIENPASRRPSFVFIYSNRSSHNFRFRVTRQTPLTRVTIILSQKQKSAVMMR